MINFYIRSVMAIGKDKRPSAVEFKDGFNLISGASNTGKSFIRKCIYFIFGSNDMPFNAAKTGYDTIIMKIVTSRGEIEFKRSIDSSSKIDVSSKDEVIESQQYNCGNSRTDPHINSVWLKLMGIEFQPKVPRNEQITKLVNFTWRTITHMFFIDENRIGNESSILKSKGVSDTSFIAALLVLIRGEDFSDFEEAETQDIKKAKKQGAIDFANNAIGRLTEQKAKLAKRKTQIPNIDINKEMEKIIKEISMLESRIVEAQGQSRRVLQDIYATNEKLTQCEIMLDRHRALREKYESNIKRLTFIVDGEIRKPILARNEFCPYCDSQICCDEEEHSYMEEARDVATDTLEQLESLRKTEEKVSIERDHLLAKINDLRQERVNIESLIQQEWTPKTNELRKALKFYSDTIKLEKEIADVEKFATELTIGIRELDVENPNERRFKPKEELNRKILDVIDKYLFSILKDCKYEPLTSAYFDKEKLATVINGTSQLDNGEGYRAFLNTVLALTWMKYLSLNAVFKPGFLLIDKPVTPLMEPKYKESTETMRTALFEYFLNNQDYGQVIIIENEAPNLDYSSGNHINFTRNEKEGRYGFLLDFRSDVVDETDEEQYNT